MDELEDILKNEFKRLADYEESLLENDLSIPNGINESLREKLSKQIKEREELYEKLTAEDYLALESAHKKLEKENSNINYTKKGLWNRLKDFFKFR